MDFDLVIKNAKIVSSSTIFEACLAVKDGKIVSFSKDANSLKSEKTIDVKGCLTLPGIIDVHVHFREPGLTYKEDFLTGSMAAAAGGVTTVADMPNTIPPTLDVESFKVKAEKAEGRCYVNLGFIAGVVKTNLDKVFSLGKAGVLGFKMFMTGTLGFPMDDNYMFKAFRLVKEASKPIFVHAEDPQIIQDTTQKVKESGKKDFMAWVESRPGLAEAKAISKVVDFSQKTGCKTHVCHVSSKTSVKVLEEAKTRNSLLTCETCPHYLLLDVDRVKDSEFIPKITPPIRFKDDKESLWEGLLNGTIDLVASDHSPHLKEEKLKDSVWDAASGFVGVETMVPLMLTQVNLGRLSINHYVKVSSENPAKLLGVYPKKGLVQVGSDADLTIVDLKKEVKIRSEKLHSKSRVTPFDGWKVKGVPIYTIVNGNIVMEQGEIVGEPKGKVLFG